MNKKIELIPVKYNDCSFSPQLESFEGMAEVVLNGPDHALLLLIESDDDMDLLVHPGNTVFAGGPLNLRLSTSDRHVCFLECGPYVHHNSDGTDSIIFETTGGVAYMVAYQLN